MITQILWIAFVLLPPTIGPTLHMGERAAPPSTAQEKKQETILPAGGDDAAGNLQVKARCSDVKLGTSLATFMWNTAKKRGEAQRVDITMFHDGFTKGRFQTLVRLDGGQQSADWSAGDPGVNYYWRVLTLTSKGWVSSDTARYEAPICPVDEFRKEEKKKPS